MTRLPHYDDQDAFAPNLSPSDSAAPPYSPDLDPSEHALLHPSDQSLPTVLTLPSVDSPELWRPDACYVYGGSMLSISLGRRLWGMRHPAYGTGAVLKATFKLGRKCTHAFRITATLHGNASATATSGGRIASMFEHTVVSETVSLDIPAGTGFFPADVPFTFTLPFPAAVKGTEDTPLPPTYMCWTPGLTCEVAYVFKIDVYRKGLRRHEGRVIPLQYLPKSWPERVHLSEAHLIDFLPFVRACKIVRPDRSRHALQMRLAVHAPDAPALAPLLLQNASFVLLKRTRVWADGPSQRGVSGREIVIGRATVPTTDVTTEGLAVGQFEVCVRRAGEEQSWSVQGTMEVVYYIRINVAALKGLPTYVHEERIHVATEPWGTRERELLQLGGASAPALGMRNKQMELCPTASAAW